jgi:hypothetical protein
VGSLIPHFAALGKGGFDLVIEWVTVAVSDMAAGQAGPVGRATR